MAPSMLAPGRAIDAIAPLPLNSTGPRGGFDWRSVASPEDLVLESWSQGFVVGGIIIMLCITVANMRRHILLHKLIVLEQLMALTHGTFCFMDFPGYGWYLSSTAALLYLSYILHNVVAWMKVRPFFHGSSSIFQPTFARWTERVYIISLACTVPPVLFQITDNFRFFNGYGGWYRQVRPYEPLMRDPWWIFCSGVLFYVVSRSYGMNTMRIIRKSPRFGILFVAIILALIFTVLDLVTSIVPFVGSTLGINPFWKLSLVFKLLTDAILLDDFKTELRRLGLKRLEKDEKRRGSVALTLDDDDFRYDSDENIERNFSSPTISRTQTNTNTSGQSGHNGHDGTNGHDWLHNPARARKECFPSLGNSDDDFIAALNTDPGGRNSSRTSENEKGRPQVGQGGTKATRLPQTFFQAIRPAKLSKKKDSAVNMLEPERNLSDHEKTPGMSRKTSKRTSVDKGSVSIPDETEARIEDEGPTLPPKTLPEKPQKAVEIVPDDDTLEQARRMNETTMRELEAEKADAGSDGDDEDTPRPGSPITAMHADVRNRKRSSQILTSGGQNDVRVQSHEKGKSKPVKHWWDQIEDDLDEWSEGGSSTSKKESAQQSSVEVQEDGEKKIPDERQKEESKRRRSKEWWDEIEDDIEWMSEQEHLGHDTVEPEDLRHGEEK